MLKLNDGVHNCSTCELYPCTSRDFLEDKGTCKECGGICCRHFPLIPLLPCEQKSERILKGEFSVKFFKNGNCFAFIEGIGCKISDIKPIACRIDVCRKLSEALCEKGIKVEFIP